MKLNKLSKWLFVIPCICIPTTISTVSCAEQKEAPKKIDGSDWTGVTSGCYFDVFDYEIDQEAETVTYIASTNIQGKDIKMPNYVIDKNETKYKVLLGPNCFKENGGIIGSFECNDFMNSIPDSCFESSWQLGKIIMHNYPEFIGKKAFTGTQLSEFLIKQNEETNTNWTICLKSIGEKAFQLLPRLSGDLFFSETLETIGEYAFDHCSNLRGVDFRFSNRCFSIGNSAFLGCSYLENVTLPPNLTKIEDNAFRGCNSLTKVMLPRDNMSFSLGDGVFYDCLRLINFSRPCNLTNIGIACFANDASLSPEFMPWINNNLEVISESAFTRTNYSSVIFNDDCPNDIKDGAFNSCEQLNTIDFSNCSPNLIPKWQGNNIFLYTSSSGTIWLPHGADINKWHSVFYNGSTPTQGIIIDAQHWQMMSK